MATIEYLRAAFHRLLRWCCVDLQRRGAVMSVVDFEDLQALSGYRQPSKVIDWLSGKGIRFVIGGDGKPRTTDDFLAEDLDGKATEKKAAAVLFTR